MAAILGRRYVMLYLVVWNRLTISFLSLCEADVGQALESQSPHANEGLVTDHAPRKDGDFE